MIKPRLYLFIGAPGAGKTAIAMAIAEATGAQHIWADTERHKLFGEPTHSKEESDQLYARLNDSADRLLAEGRDVVYDTNFNFYADRQRMRRIAAKHDADTIIIWVTTPNEVARQRAVGEHVMRNGYLMTMTAEQFDSITSKLEPPKEDEKVIKIDASRIDRQQILGILDLQ